MNLRIKAGIYLSLFILLLLSILLACTEPGPAIDPSPPDDTTGKAMNVPSDNETQNLPGDSISQIEPLKKPDKVEIVYFYAPQRCTNCIYIEERVTFVVETCFQDEIDSGRLVFKKLNLGDKENLDMANKYRAISSQLFINPIVDGVDHIINIKEVWFKEYLKDEKAFDELIKGYIDRGLNGEL